MYITPPKIIPKPPIDATNGQGLGSKKLKGCLQLFLYSIVDAFIYKIIKNAKMIQIIITRAKNLPKKLPTKEVTKIKEKFLNTSRAY